MINHQVIQRKSLFSLLPWAWLGSTRSLARVSIPLIGIGGIATWRDAIEPFLAGASAIQVGMANFVRPKAVAESISGIEAYMGEQGLTPFGEIVGRARG